MDTKYEGFECGCCGAKGMTIVIRSDESWTSEGHPDNGCVPLHLPTTVYNELLAKHRAQQPQAVEA